MNNILSKNQAFELDKKTINNYNIPARTLMGEAGKYIANYIDIHSSFVKKSFIICSPSMPTFNIGYIII